MPPAASSFTTLKRPSCSGTGRLRQCGHAAGSTPVSATATVPEHCAQRICTASLVVAEAVDVAAQRARGLGPALVLRALGHVVHALCEPGDRGVLLDLGVGERVAGALGDAQH